MVNALRLHEIGAPEIMPSVGDQGAVTRMIDGLHPRDDVDQPGIMVVDMFQKFGLGVRRAGDQDGAGIRHRLRNGMEKILALGSMPAADGIGLMMYMPGRVFRMQHQAVDLRRPKMEHAGFMVIDPDNGVVVAAHILFLGALWTAFDTVAGQSDRLIAGVVKPR
jgi:hypothetical protein